MGLAAPTEHDVAVTDVESEMTLRPAITATPATSRGTAEPLQGVFTPPTEQLGSESG